MYSTQVVNKQTNKYRAKRRLLCALFSECLNLLVVQLGNKWLNAYHQRNAVERYYGNEAPFLEGTLARAASYATCKTGCSVLFGSGLSLTERLSFPFFGANCFRRSDASGLCQYWTWKCYCCYSCLFLGLANNFRNSFMPGNSNLWLQAGCDSLYWSGTILSTWIWWYASLLTMYTARKETLSSIYWEKLYLVSVSHVIQI